MTHLPYVAAAYGAALAVLCGLVAWVVLDNRAQRRRLDALQSEGRRHGAPDGRA